MKIRPVGAELFHADGRTDKRKLGVAFRNSANAPKKRKCVSIQRFPCSEIMLGGETQNTGRKTCPKAILSATNLHLWQTKWLWTRIVAELRR